MKTTLAVFLMVFLSACAQLVPSPRPVSAGHIQAEEKAPKGEIPKVVEETPPLPKPQPTKEPARYTVVVNEVPVKELLFAIARDANMNVDISPAITGVVTLNAVQQTLPQILDRVAQQVDLRYQVNGSTIELTPDTPYLHTYKVDFLNMSRDTTTSVALSTEVAAGKADVTASGGGGTSTTGNNNSTTQVKSTSNQRFWATLVSNIAAIVGDPAAATGGAAGTVPSTKSVQANPEAGLLTVMATGRQHKQIQQLIDAALASVERQVLVEATIVEVTLRDQYSAGIDWSKIVAATGAGISYGVSSVNAAGFNPANIGQFFTLNYHNNAGSTNLISATLSLLKEYGDVRVLSSPQLMVLNNQTALLKVVDNQVYFTVDVQTTTNQTTTDRVFQTNIHTVPVGLVMSVTPQINDNGAVMMNVRPTISRITSFVNDPNPDLKQAGVTSPIPVIQTREMESLLKVDSGQTAVLGGLMQDNSAATTQGVPGFQDIFPFGELFKHRNNNYSKTELVIFLRPTVVKNASLDGDLQNYRQFLKPTFDTGVVKPPEAAGKSP